MPKINIMLNLSHQNSMFSSFNQSKQPFSGATRSVDMSQNGLKQNFAGKIKRNHLPMLLELTNQKIS
jgi:hypothetical protein